MRDGTPIALLGATGHRARSFGKTGIDVAVILANYLSVAMANAELYRVLTEREQELHQRATHDPLTGLANRTEAGQRIDDALDHPTGAVGLLFCDIDKFKAVNDRLGHEVGDELIQQVALRLSGAVRRGDLLARFGGDEFVFVLDGVHDLTDLHRGWAADPGQPGRPDPAAGRTGAGDGEHRLGAGPCRHHGQRHAPQRRRRHVRGEGQGPGRIEVFDDAAAHRSVDWLDLRSELVTRWSAASSPCCTSRWSS